MPTSFRKEDLRVKRTYKSLVESMLKILQHTNFNQVTVNDLCEEALISRATFYVHFNDKYNLLKYYLSTLCEEFIEDIYIYEKFSIKLNQYIKDHQKIVENILLDANNETLELVSDVIATIINASMENRQITKNVFHYKALSSFCTGGMLNILLSHVKNNFPEDSSIMDIFLYEMLKNIMEYDNYKKIENKGEVYEK